MMSRLRPNLSPRERGQLERAGLIELERRGRARHVTLTDDAWSWVANHLDAEISPSRYAVLALSGLLAALKIHLDRQRITLAEFVAPQQTAGPPDIDLADRIRAAYFQASDGGSNRRVRLTDLRPFLSDLPKVLVDAQLLRMHREGRYGLVLWSLDDPWDTSPEDQEAAVDIAGVKRHILYMET